MAGSAEFGRWSVGAMVIEGGYPREWLDRVPAVVFACLVPGEIRILLHPGVGLTDGGAQRDVPVVKIPPESRMPNTRLWVQLDGNMNVLSIWRREE